jgi:predicted dehydrogenase
MANNVAIIGAGFIGKKRALCLPKGVTLSHVCDVDEVRAKNFAEEFSCAYETDWKKIVSHPKIDLVMVATTHNFLAPIAAAAIANGKHVLVEKPGGRNLKDLSLIEKAYKKKKTVIAFGYNHRYHPAMLKARELISSGSFGPVLFIRAKYGHGGRLGYEKEWRFNKEISGGGELIDQGPHLIDLVNFFHGKMKYHSSLAGTFFWKTKLDDTAFFILKDAKAAAQLSVSCVEWKNTFCFEIILKSAKIQIDGLGRSYGPERLTLFTMKPEMGPPDIKTFDFEEDDSFSWKYENKLFFDRIKAGETGDKELKDARYVFEIIEKIYKKNT